MIKIHDQLTQGTDEWLAARCGMLTASNVKKLFTKTHALSKGETGKTLAHELLAQRITQYVEPQYWSDDMLRGCNDEIIARNIYSLKYNKAHEVGFITREFTNAGVTFTLGYSPDGLVGDPGCIEVKSRCQKFQVRTILDGVCPGEYMLQVQTGMLVANRKWCDFVSFCGGMPMFVCRVLPDAELQQKILTAATDFERTLQANQAIYAANITGLTMTERTVEEELFV